MEACRADRAVDHRTSSLIRACTSRLRPGCSVGEWTRARVRVFPDPRTGVIQLEWRQNGRRITRSLGHGDWNRAKMQTDEVGATALFRPRYRRAEAAHAEDAF